MTHKSPLVDFYALSPFLVYHWRHLSWLSTSHLFRVANWMNYIFSVAFLLFWLPFAVLLVFRVFSCVGIEWQIYLFFFSSQLFFICRRCAPMLIIWFAFVVVEEFVLLLRDSFNLMNMTSFGRNGGAMMYRLRITSARPSTLHQVWNSETVAAVDIVAILAYFALWSDYKIVIDLILIEMRFEIQLNSFNGYDLFVTISMHLIAMKSIRRRSWFYWATRSWINWNEWSAVRGSL